MILFSIGRRAFTEAKAWGVCEGLVVRIGRCCLGVLDIIIEVFQRTGIASQVSLFVSRFFSVHIARVVHGAE